MISVSKQKPCVQKSSPLEILNALGFDLVNLQCTPTEGMAGKMGEKYPSDKRYLNKTFNSSVSFPLLCYIKISRWAV